MCNLSAFEIVSGIASGQTESMQRRREGEEKERDKERERERERGGRRKIGRRRNIGRRRMRKGNREKDRVRKVAPNRV